MLRWSWLRLLTLHRSGFLRHYAEVRFLVGGAIQYVCTTEVVPSSVSVVSCVPADRYRETIPGPVTEVGAGAEEGRMEMARSGLIDLALPAPFSVV